ncbi:MAG: S8 family serine peptidase [candidate division WOR-3 bacterium]
MFKTVLVLVTALITLGLSAPDMTRPLVTRADGVQYVSGQLIVELAPELRGQVNLTEVDGIVLFSVPKLDELSRRFHVDDIMPLMRNPNPDPTAVALGCDLQYLVQFNTGFDAPAVAAAYLATGLVEFAEPNIRMPVDEEPNDPRYVSQWHLARLGAPFAWGVAKGDTSVTNLVIDQGLDWLHPDIQDNIWINGPEDINGNGRFDTLPPPDGDMDGIDNDGNFYTDDVIGWDFVEGEPNPMPSPPDDHGTHCWGIVNAVTNNAEGVAGTTWNTRSLAVRCGFGGGIYIGQAVGAIYYAVPEGIWAVSMSFGSSYPSQALADACMYAWSEGRVLYGSAGNDGAEAVRYPACHEGVENVAASGTQDTKTSWSNYGTWVDITAPGDGILATLNQCNGSYGSLSGTSMSCPLAAGVACWMKSFDPALTNDACTSKMHAACDSMPDPLYRQGKLGAGRVSMANLVLPLFYCDLRLTDRRFNDASGNGNGRPDPGETAALVVTYSNAAGWRDATGVSATLTASSSRVQILKGTATFPDIPAGSSGNCSADSFVISIPPGTPPQQYTFCLTVTATPTPAWPDTSFTSISGEPRVLIVDDDLGQNYERWYTSACDSNGVLYHTFNVQAQGSPSADTLKHYPVVIWYTGDDSLTTLTATDRTNLAAFLDNGGKLLISGKSLAQNIASESFLADYLHAQFVEPSTGKPYLVGYVGDPITGGDTMVAGGGGGANNGQSLDGVRPVGGGVGCAFFKDYADTTLQAVVRYSGNYHVVFFSIPFEAIDHSVTRYLQKWTLIRRILLWFGEGVPGVEERPPIAPDSRPYVLNITPNPFSRSCRVEFIAPVSGQVELRTYSVNGRLVNSQTKTVKLGERTGFVLEAADLASGTYFVQLVTSEGVFAQKAAVLR